MWFLQCLVDEHSPDVGSVFGLPVFLVQFEYIRITKPSDRCSMVLQYSVHPWMSYQRCYRNRICYQPWSSIDCLPWTSFLSATIHLVLQTPKLVAVHPNCMLSNDVLCVHHCMIWIPLKNIYADRMQKVDPCPRDPGNLRTFTRLRRAMHWLWSALKDCITSDRGNPCEIYFNISSINFGFHPSIPKFIRRDNPSCKMLMEKGKTNVEDSQSGKGLGHAIE